MGHLAGQHLKCMRAVLGSDGNNWESQIKTSMKTTWWLDNETGQIPSDVSAGMLSSDWGRIRGKANVWALCMCDWTSQLMGKLDSIDPSWSPSLQTSTNYSQSHKTQFAKKKKVIQTCLATKTSYSNSPEDWKIGFWRIDGRIDSPVHQRLMHSIEVLKREKMCSSRRLFLAYFKRVAAE